MLLTIDIGNTNVSLAVMKGNRVVKVFSIDASLKSSPLKSKIDTYLSRINKAYTLDGVIVCSVVPKILKMVKSRVKVLLKIQLLIVGQNVLVPIKNRYQNPKQVGQDRLVCAFAAHTLFGKPLIIIDSGTAITFDVVSKKGEYLGGIITPGIRLSAEALFKKTALLPRAQIKAPKQLIGRDTQTSILSGLFYGYGALSNGIIDQISKKVGEKPKVIITGGYTDLMKKFIGKKVTHTEKNLVFKGMKLLHNQK